MEDNDQPPKKPNGNGKDHDAGEASHNIIRMPTLAERDKMRREKEAAQEAAYRSAYKAQKAANAEPFLNLPATTKYFLAVIFVAHLAFSYAFSPVQQAWVYSHLAFIPGYYSGQMPAPLWTMIFSPLTYSIFHGDWFHLGVNGLMMLAFGAGAEKMLGWKKVSILFVACTLAAALAHFALNPLSTAPMIGASGGLSGLFGAMLILLKERGMVGRNRGGIWPFVVIWILISVVFGMMGTPTGGTIAWAAHIGGFFAGLGLVNPVRRLKL